MKLSSSILPIILAAGKGTRMRSSLPKVLHTIGGKPMLAHVIDACSNIGADKLTIIYGHSGEVVKEVIESRSYAMTLSWILQAEQKGTGHAVDQARQIINDEDLIIIAYGDVPLISSKTLNTLLEAVTYDVSLALLTTILDDPSGYGRVIRNEQGDVVQIVEEKDATHDVRQIHEVNSGFMAVRGKDLKHWLSQLTSHNAQGEYYLTDCIEMAAKKNNQIVKAVVCADPLEVQGVNDRMQQAELERAYQANKVRQLMIEGATLLDPNRVDIRGKVTIGRDVSIDVNVIFKGNVVLGDEVIIDSGCILDNCTIGKGSHIYAHSLIEQSIVEKACNIGPFARLRPDSYLKTQAKVGNFVEIKKSRIGEGSKVSHLTYIGDTEMGDNVNVGAGTITCNYDGANKYKTMIGNDVFIGSSSQLIAPVILGDGSTVGAGSTITKDIPANQLSLSRAKQVTIKHWVRPSKKK